MSILFLISMFLLSFTPLWVCIICIDVKSLVDGTNCPYTECIGLGIIASMLFFSALITLQTLKKRINENTEEYMVAAVEKDTVSTTTYLLSNVLPLLAFDFTQWFDTVQFMISGRRYPLQSINPHRFRTCRFPASGSLPYV